MRTLTPHVLSSPPSTITTPTLPTPTGSITMGIGDMRGKSAPPPLPVTSLSQHVSIASFSIAN
jgi:hypothetical protein